MSMTRFRVDLSSLTVVRKEDEEARRSRRDGDFTRCDAAASRQPHNCFQSGVERTF